MEVLVIVDMQKDFCYPQGTLYIKGVEKIFENTKKVVERARDRDIKVFFTQDWHREDDEEFKVWPKHCIMNTWGAEIIDELRPKKEDYYVKKRRYSAFFATDLDLTLRELKVEKIFLCGVATNICVLHTAGDATMKGYKVAIIEDCTKALSDFDQEYAIRHMKNVFNADIINSRDFALE